MKKIRDLRRAVAEARRALAIGLKVQRAETDVMALTGCSQREAQTVIGACVDNELEAAVEAAKRMRRD